MSDAQLKASADRCSGCKWRDNPLRKTVCEQCPKHRAGSGSEVVDIVIDMMEQAAAGEKTLDVMPKERDRGGKALSNALDHLLPRKPGRKLSPDSNERKGSEMSAERGASPRPACRSHRSHAREVEAIRKLVRAIGGIFNLTHQGGKLHGTAGIPDAYVQIPLRKGGRRFFVEVKVGRDKLNPAQVGFKQAEETCGGTVIVGGESEVEKHLREIGFLSNERN
jgi:hypothetical protein